MTNSRRIRKYICHSCYKVFCDRTNTAFYDLRTSEEKVELALKMAMRGMSVLEIAEVLSVKPSTVVSWISRAADHCEKVNEVVLNDVETPKVEMDELWTFVGGKVLKDGEYEDEETWIWLSMATDSRLVISHVIGEWSQESANMLVEKAAQCLRSLPLFVTDGLNFYRHSLLRQHGTLQAFPLTGKQGRPKLPRLIVSNLLRYAQVIKHRVGGFLIKIKKKNIIGKNIDPKMISTSYVERLNLTCRQDNNRISRKTIGFSKNRDQLDHQMTISS